MHNCHSKKNSKLNSTPVCFYFESRLIINKVEKKVVVFFALFTLLGKYGVNCYIGKLKLRLCNYRAGILL